jgi:1,2-dihydroxy-3-keto-5-methylthiopentene dioxygenase
MPQLKIFSKEQSMHLHMETRLPLEIEQLLGDVGVIYKHIDIATSAQQLMSDDEMMLPLKQKIMAAYPQHQFKACSLASVSELFPNYERLRLRYLSEYYVEEDEAYLIIEGKCLISMHYEDQVLQLMCEKGDFIALPRKILRWMDMGGKASFTVLKCSEQEEAPVIFYTGSNISDRFPRLEL